MPLPPSLKNLVMGKLAKTNKVKLPNGRTFTARYERRSRSKKGVPPSNVQLKSFSVRAAPEGQHRRRRVTQQHGQSLGSLLRLAKKVVRNPIVKKLSREILSRLPDLYSKGTSKIKNENLKRIPAVGHGKFVGRYGCNIRSTKTRINVL